MKAIILAAGKGTRIAGEIDGIPKSTLRLSDETPIIRRSVVNMLELGIEPIVCVGYRKELVIKALDGLNIRFIDNPFYSITNNIVSLWFAKDYLYNDDIILSSADLYYPKTFLDKLAASESNLTMIVDSSRVKSGDFYFSVIDDGFISQYGPDLPLKDRSYEYMGLSKISSQYVDVVRTKVEQYIEEEKFNVYFEDLIIGLNKFERERINLIDVAGSFWREFDFYEDYQAILKYEKENKNG